MRLGMNRIDLLLIHDLDFWFHTTEAKVAAYLGQLFTSGWRALDQLRSHGLIRGVGAGINELGMMPRFLDMVGLDFFLVALRYTLMEQDVLEAEFPYCERLGVGVVVGGVYNSGITATGPIAGAKYNYADATPEVMERVRRMEAVCKAHGVPLAAAALQFPLAHPDRRLGHSRRRQPGSGAAERREFPPRDSRLRFVVGSQAEGTAFGARADARLSPPCGEDYIGSIRPLFAERNIASTTSTERCPTLASAQFSTCLPRQRSTKRLTGSTHS